MTPLVSLALYCEPNALKLHVKSLGGLNTSPVLSCSRLEAFDTALLEKIHVLDSFPL